MCLHSKITDFHFGSAEIKCAEFRPPSHVLHAPYFGLPDFFSIKTRAKRGDGEGNLPPFFQIKNGNVPQCDLSTQLANGIVRNY